MATAQRRRRSAGPQTLPEKFTDLKEDRLDARGDYDAAKYSIYSRNRTGYLAMGSGADWHYRIELQYLRIMERSRDMARNDAVIGPLFESAVNNTIMGGFRPRPNTGDRGANRALRDRWENWSEDADQVDIAGERDFHAMEKDTLRHEFADGDHMGLLMKSGQIQLIEAHRCRTPRMTKKNVALGVLMDDKRRRVAYYFTKEDVSPYSVVELVGDTDIYPVRDSQGNRQVLHIYDPKRVTQTRGVTALSPCMDESGMWEDLNFATLVKAQAQSCFGIVRTPAKGTEDLPAVDEQYGARTLTQLGNGATRISEAIGPGMQIQAEAGETITPFHSNTPNAEFFPHAKLILTLICINVGTPFCVAMMDASEVNFNGWRGANSEARRRYRHNQNNLVLRFHRPVWRWKCLQWAAEDPGLRKVLEKDRESYLRHHWQKPAWPYEQPLQDAGADLVRVRNAMTSHRRYQAERGSEWDEISTEIVDDNGMAIIKAMKKVRQITKLFPDMPPPHWRELISLPTPDGVKIDITSQENNDQAGAKSGKLAK